MSGAMGEMILAFGFLSQLRGDRIDSTRGNVNMIFVLWLARGIAEAFKANAPKRGKRVVEKVQRQRIEVAESSRTSPSTSIVIDLPQCTTTIATGWEKRG
ncbi:hypothetical protein AMTR_s00044p00173220 [Amborella trichopoda]|uniref:Uncharacterized protein n=1 Tax=Amborella trichopoda TaxID=13333 RepID=U5D4S2_AMBTC|nr:hypothetical protein AMTR_s00044p00173220 [Amborella trichopoda]